MVKCANCGFLCRIRKQVDAEVIVYQATSHNREEGDFSRYSAWPKNEYDIPTQITCFRNATYLQKELTNLFTEQQSDRNIVNQYTLTLINTPRKCESWYLWTEHLTPKEHLEKLDREQWQKWLEEQRKSDKKWRIFELAILVIAAGLFTLLGAAIS